MDYAAVISRGDDPDDMLQPDENVTRFRLELGQEAETAGLVILDDDFYHSRIGLNEEGLVVVVFYVEVEAGKQNSPLFDGGLLMPVKMTIWTDHEPPRIKQRTLVIMGINQ